MTCKVPLGRYWVLECTVASVATELAYRAQPAHRCQITAAGLAGKSYNYDVLDNDFSRKSYNYGAIFPPLCGVLNYGLATGFNPWRGYLRIMGQHPPQGGYGAAKPPAANGQLKYNCMAQQAIAN